MKTNSLRAGWFLTAILISCFAIQTKGQGESQGQYPAFIGSTITGFVFDPERRPLADVRVELIGDIEGVLQRIKTDGSGRFVFRAVTQGRFQVKVLPFGTNYEEQTQDVELSGMSASGRPIRDTIQRDFLLRPKKSPSISGAGAIFVQEIPEEAQTVYQKAVSDIERNNLADGVAGLENALRLFPNYYLALERLGLIYTTQQKFDKALAVFDKAVIVNPRSFNGWYGLSCAHYALNQSDAAIEAAKKAVNLNSSSDDAFLVLGLSLRQGKRYEEAEKPLKQADKLTKGLSPDVHWHLALLYAKNLNRPREAADELELYLKTTPDTSQVDNIKKLIKKYRESPPPK
jgi:tetratricopeptide (TPR) repeat protein